jgi:hypothetical protein
MPATARAPTTRPAPYARLHVCTVCDKSFKTKDILKGHAVVHSVLRAFACTVFGCNSTFTRQRGLKQHAAVHSGVWAFPCLKYGCNSTFRTQGNLESHADVHSEVRAYACLVEGCNSTFKNKQKLEVHATKHSEVRGFACTVFGCNSTFKSKNVLENHAAVHIEARGFACFMEGCTSTFKTQRNLDVHITSHSDERAFPCLEFGCDWTFKSNDNLKHHVAAHRAQELRAQERVLQGVPVFPCPESGCDATFKTKGEVDSHCRMHERGQWAFQSKMEEAGYKSLIALGFTEVSDLPMRGQFSHDKGVFHDLVGIKGWRLRPDFVLRTLDGSLIWIEVDGQHHSQPVQWSKQESSEQIQQRFQSIQTYDKMKRDYAATHGIKMVVIPYSAAYTIPDLLAHLVDASPPRQRHVE